MVSSIAADLNYSSNDIGIYIRPQHQGASYHIEFNLPYDPNNATETEKTRTLFERASKTLMAQGAYFSRPYGIWSEMMYQRDADSTAALHKIKNIFDPNHIMNPGKLCF